MLLNKAYWYGASLQPGGAGGTAGGAPGATSAPQYAPFVKTQAPQSDGSIVHTVVAGDTLSSIAVAYHVTVAQIRALNNLDPDNSVLQIGQKLLIQPAGTAAATMSTTMSATLDVSAPTLAVTDFTTPTQSTSDQDTPTPQGASALIQNNLAATSNP
jgi:LysM repeat protein